MKINKKSLLSQEKKNKTPGEFNNTRRENPGPKTLHRLFAEQVERTPDHTALVGQIPGEINVFHQVHLSYRELNKKSNRLAHYLCQLGVKENEFIGIMADRGPGMIIGILAILKAGCAYVPLNPRVPPARTKYILGQCGVRLVLTRTGINQSQQTPAGHPLHDTGPEITYLDIDGCDNSPGMPGENPAEKTLPGGFAYVIFTSGSTGTPKGVPITHANLSPLLHWGFKHLGLNSGGGDRTLQNLAYCFDWSVWEIMITLTSGAVLYIAPDDVLLDPAACIAFIQKHAVTVLHATPTWYRHLQVVETRLDTLKYLFIGAEKFTLDLLKRSYESIPGHCRLFNMYGPTEATIIAAVLELHRGPGQEEQRYDELASVPIGKAVANTRLLVLDEDFKPCPVNKPGQLVILGDGLSRGYLNSPEFTAEKFVPVAPGFYKSSKSYRSYIRYHTGDLARWLEDGNIEFLGRVDFQVKIRGFRIELGEIENRLLEHERIKEAIVIDRPGQGEEKYLCAYIVPSHEKAFAKDLTGELRDYLSHTLPDYMVPAYFLRIENLPLDPNGKVDRRALPEPETASAANVYTAPRNLSEEKIAGIWASVLGLDKKSIGIDDNFFQLGGHSLKGTTALAKIHQQFNVRLTLEDIFKTPTLRGLAVTIKKAAGNRYNSIERVEKKEYYGLSSAQMRLYILDQIESAGTAYNIPILYGLAEEPERGRLEEALKQLIQGQESFRTSFILVNHEPVQRIHEKVPFDIEYYDLATEEEIQHSSFITHHSFVRPFDLSAAPLLRVGLFKIEKEKPLLLVDMHHIISDGTSIEIFKNQLLELYDKKELTPLTLQYKDYAQWQNKESPKEKLKDQEQYWLKEFAGEIPVLNLPLDFPRPAVQDFAGHTLVFELEKEKTAALNHLAETENVTLFMVFFSILNILLAKLSGQEDIIIGIPAAGRRHAGLENIIGMFINTLALRNNPGGAKKFNEFLKEIKTKTLEAFENQEYQFEDLVEALKVHRDASRNPLFNVMFAFQNLERRKLKQPGLQLTPRPYKTRTAKFDLTLYVEETGKGLSLQLEYRTKLFKEKNLHRFIRYFREIITAITGNPGIRTAEIEILSAAEKQEILGEFNNRYPGYPGNKTIVELFTGQVEQTPDQMALVGQTPNHRVPSGENHLSYRELQEKAGRLAHQLKEKGGRADTIVAILTEHSVELIIGLLAILKAGAAYLPLDPKAPAERIDYMLKDSSANIILKDHDLSLGLSSAPRVSDRLGAPHPPKGQLAYVIYTSGSTGKPKGVPVTHANLCPLLHWGYRHLGIGTKDRTLRNLAYYFDWSVWEIFITLTTGASLYSVPGEVLLNPGACIAFMNRHAVTVLHVTPTQYGYLVREQQQPGSLKYLFIGAEKLTYDLVHSSFTSIAADCRVFNMYGPTEATIISAVLELHRSDYHRYRDLASVPIGKPSANATLLVLDKHLNLCPVKIAGELFIGGANLASGYLNNPELSAERFCLRRPGGRFLKKLPPWTPHKNFLLYQSPIYRTGDLARWLEDGNIEFLGRVDFQVKIRGFRIELGEIENRLLEHESIRETLVIDRQGQGEEKYLCAYIVTTPGKEKPLDDRFSQELREHLSQTLPTYMIPSYFLRIENLPLDPNGKVDRRALPEPETAAAAKIYTAPRDEGEEKIAGIWASVLGLDKRDIGIDDNFFQLGGHSLKGTTALAKIHQQFNVKLTLDDIFKTPTIRGLAVGIKGTTAAGDRYRAIEILEKKEYYGLSPAQKRLYILDQIESAGTAYNIPTFYLLAKEPDRGRLEQAFKQLIRRQESFRASFNLVKDEPVQRIHDRVPFAIEDDNLATEDTGEEERKRGSWEVRKTGREDDKTQAFPKSQELRAKGFFYSFIQPFDLSRAPLLRAALIKAQEKWLLLVDMHHIISDGTSMEIFKKELPELYDKKELAPLALQYKDYARWQNKENPKEKLEDQEQYWLKEFAGELPVLNLPIDFPRPALQAFAGHTLGFELEEEETDALNHLARAENVTLFMVLFSIFNILLAKLSGQEDIISGIPAAGRRHAGLENIIGMFINTLALRSYPGGEKKFNEFLKEIKNNTLGAFENQEYQFEDLVEVLKVHRDASRNPLFDVMFAFQNLGHHELKQPGLQLTPHPYETRIAKFDLTLYVEETGKSLCLQLEYGTKLFKPPTLRRFIRSFNKILAAVTSNPETRLSELEIISAEEKKKILYEFNDTTAEYPANKTFPQLFAQQVQRTPDRVALIGQTPNPKSKTPNQRVLLSYRELKEKTHRLAETLREKGVQANTIVGIMVERSVEMVIGIFAVLEAGGAYLPIDPAYPPDRISYMLNDSGAEILLEADNLSSWLASAPERRLNPSPGPPFHPGNLVYMIYTSGSTGQPKGVMVKIKGFINLIHWYAAEFAIDFPDCVLLMAPISFDLAQKNLFGPLSKGAVLYLAPPGLPDYHELSGTVAKQQITIINCAPSVFYPLLDFNGADDFVQLKSLRYVFLGGEPIHGDKFIPWFDSRHCRCKLVNTYGPTECTDIASFYLASKREILEKTAIPIGRPINNVSLFILDRYLHPLPIGVIGELCIGGLGVSKGYHKKPRLNAEKFLKNPHLPAKEIYRTGDMARWRPDGNVEFLGRIDHQVKVRGNRIELEEIENRLLNLQAVKEAVLTAIPGAAGDNYLCAYIVLADATGGDTVRIDRQISTLREYLAKALPDYMIPSYFVPLETIPLTPSGKVNRKALPPPVLTGETRRRYTPPRSEIEKILLEIWAGVLGLNNSSIGIDDNFFRLGGHSLKATIALSKIHRRLKVKLTLGDIFKTPTIRGLAVEIKGAAGADDGYRPIAPLEKKDYYALSPAQKRLYILDRIEYASTAYNIPTFYLLEKEPDRDRLEQTFKQLIHRHESFRTSFILVKDEPVQRIHDRVPFAIQYNDLTTADTGEENYKLQNTNYKQIPNYKSQITNKSEDAIHREKSPLGTKGLNCDVVQEPKSQELRAKSYIYSFIRPFDLSRPPLLRVQLVRTGQDRYILAVDMHHIISDGTSMEIFKNQWTVLYDARQLPPLPLQYKDYARWQNKEHPKEKLKNQEQYWLKEFAGEIPVLNLPLDFPRPAVQGFAGHTLVFELEKEETAALNHLAETENVTLFMVLFSIFNILLAKLSGQEDIVIAIPAAGRRHAGLENIIGMFINTLALRSYPGGEKKFNEFLKEIKNNTLDAFENQEYQFEDLVEVLKVHRDASRNPLFDVMFALQNIGTPGTPTTTPVLKPYDVETAISKFDLTLSGQEVDNRIIFQFDYSTKLFKQETVERFIDYFKRLAASVTRDCHSRIAALRILPPGEKKRLLMDFNDTGAAYPRDNTIQQLFQQQAERAPDSIALVGKCMAAASKTVTLTSRELREKSNRLAQRLIEKNVKPGTIVAIMVERSIEMIIGLMGILTSGGAYLPLNPAYPPERIDYMLNDCRTKILVTTGTLVEEGEKFRRWEGEKDFEIVLLNTPFSPALLNPDLPNFLTSRPPNFPLFPATGHRPPATSLAYVIYTSGSGGRPKGVIVEHRNVVNVVSWFARSYLQEKGTHVLMMSDYTFDPSVNQVFSSLLHRAVLYVPAKELLTNLDTLRQYIRRRQIQVVNFVPAVLNELLGQVQRLASIKVILSGGERLDDALKDRLLEKGYVLYNQYGPTETTIDALVEKCSLTAKVTLGHPIANVSCYIVDPYLELTPLGVSGELLVGGNGVSRGYLNNPELTAEKFVSSFNRYYRSYKSYRSYIFYKTGDLARWLENGKIQFLGRKDNQVKIRGFRVELEEIERCLTRHREIKEAVVLAREAPKKSPGDQLLCAYLVPGNQSNPPLSPAELREFLSGNLPDHMIPWYFVYIKAIPLTPNGKIDRKSLPAPVYEKRAAYTAPGDEIEEKLVRLWSGVLLVEKEKIGIDSNFFELGGHSLKATIAITKIHRQFDVKLTLADIFKTPTIRGLAAHVKETAGDRFHSIARAEKKEYYGLSSAQKRLYIMAQMELAGTGYNIPAFYRLPAEPDRGRLEQAFKQLIRRHESFRTSFIMLEDEPVQRIHDQVPFEIEDDNLGDRQWAIGDRDMTDKKEPGSHHSSFIDHHSFVRPFDLADAPLLRASLIKAPGKWLLLVDMHHIISDGTSMGIFKKELLELYDLNELPPLALQYKDYAQWQNKENRRETFRHQEEYWLNRFQAEIPVLNLPADFPRPALQRFSGNTLVFELEKEETDALNRLARSGNATLFMVLSAVFTILLAKLSGQEDIVIGTPAAGRRHADLENIIGMFINTLPLRNYPHSQKTLKAFLKEIKTTTLDAFENQEYPFEDLVERLEVNRDASRNPLFDVMFVLQNIAPAPAEAGQQSLEITSQNYDLNTAKFDITLGVEEANDILRLYLEYCTSLFKEKTLRRFIRYFKKIVTVIISSPGTRIAEIEILSAEEKHEILYQFNQPGTEYPEKKNISQLFAAQVEQTPDRVALLGSKAEGKKEAMPLAPGNASGSRHMTYRQLKEKAARSADSLRKQGVRPDTLVGIMVERSIEMVIGIFGILAAGGAYMPMDPEYPPERIDYMMKDSNAEILLKSHDLPLLLASAPQALLNLSAGHPFNFPSSYLPNFRTSPPSSLAYTIYTSGSTGKPKGVMVNHRSVMNILSALFKTYPLTQTSRYLVKTSFTFDVSVTELLGWFWGGGQAVILPKDDHKDPGKILDTIERSLITHINFVPSMFATFIDRLDQRNIGKLSGLKYIFLAGEALPPRQVEKFRQLNTSVILENLYGPTEGTIYVSGYSSARWKGTGNTGNIPIGKPLQNMTLYILDRNRFPVPVGVPGELFIAGPGTARGYLNNPELTAERFIDKALSSLLLALRKTKGAKKALRGPNQPETFTEIIRKKEKSTSKNHPLAEGVYSPEGHLLLRAKSQEPRAVFYKTGDLTRWLEDGNVEFLGRIDHQVKIRGFRIEPGEIQNRLLEHELIREAVVIARQGQEDEKYLCAYIVPTHKNAFANDFSQELREYLSQSLPDYMVPAYFIPCEKIPLTPNGKVDRNALPEPKLEAGDNYTPPGDEIEKKLLHLWAKVLARDAGQVPQLLQTIGIDHNFFHLGGHSLKATRLIAEIYHQLNVRISLLEFFQIPRIRELARHIKKSVKESSIPINPAEKKEYYPLSPTQKRFYILSRLETQGTGYHLCDAFVLEEEADRNRLSNTFKSLIKHHETLRTSFILVEDKPVQRIHPRVEFEIQWEDTVPGGTNPEAFIIRNFRQPFDLARPPLLRVKLARLAEEKYLFLFDLHHIIADAISLDLFVEEFLQIYAGDRSLPHLKLYYKDYAEWQQQLLDAGVIKRQEEYWLKRFSGKIPVLDLPLDFTRPAVQEFEGDNIDFDIPPAELTTLKEYASREQATMFMVLLAVFNILLAKLSNQEDIVIGTPTAGRRYAELYDIIGAFINTLALRNYPHEEKTFAGFLKEVKISTLEAFDHQDYQFEELVNKVHFTRDSQRNPLFDAFYSYREIGPQPPAAETAGNREKTPLLKLKEYKFQSQQTLLDLVLTIFATGDTKGFSFNMAYSTKLFKRETIEKYILYFKEIITAVVKNKQIRLKEIKISHQLEAATAEIPQINFGF